MRRSACVDTVANWMSSNRLQLNAIKTEFLWCTSAWRHNHLPTSPFQVRSDHMTPSTSVRDLGIYLDSDVNMHSQVSQTLSACFGILRQLRSILHLVSLSVFQSLIAALVLTKLDFGNATLSGIPLFQLDHLQAVMNAAARLVFQSSWYDHIIRLIQLPHWLRAPEGMSYKLAVLVYQCLHGLAPAYLTACHRTTWLTTSVPPTRLCTIGDRAFPVTAAKIWNNLPSEVTSLDCLQTFKTKLKTHLFSLSFSQLTVKWL